MRIRDDFTVYHRSLRTERVVWYYQTYDGERWDGPIRAVYRED
jgi:hypothetical protein